MDRKVEVEAHETPKPDHDLSSSSMQIANLKLAYVASKLMNPSQNQNKENSLIAGVKFKVGALRKKNDEVDLANKMNFDGKQEFEGFGYKMDTLSAAKIKLQTLNADKPKELTQHKLGISDQKIIVPSFDTTSKIFGQHLLVLQELRYNINRLR